MGGASKLTMMMYQLLTTVSSNKVTAREGDTTQANVKGPLQPRVTACTESCHPTYPRKGMPFA